MSLGDPRITEGLLAAMATCAFFSIALMQILLGLATLHWCVGLVRRTAGPLRAPLVPLLLVFLGVSLVSSATVGSLSSAREVGSGAMAMVAYLLALNALRTPAALTRALRCVVIAGTLAALFGLYQAEIGARALRIKGTLSHFYTYSGVVLIASVLALGRLLFGARKREAAALGLAFLAMLAALVQTQTRAALLGLVVGAGVLLAAWKPRRLVWLPIAVGLAYLLSPGYAKARIRSALGSGDSTVNERYEMWENGLRIWRDHPVLGVGPDRASEVYPAYRDPESPFKDVPFHGHVHDNAIQIALERGTLGLLAWLAFWIAWFVTSVRAFGRIEPGRSAERAALAAGLAAILAFHVMGCFEYNLGDSEVATLAHYVLALPIVVAFFLARERKLLPAGELTTAA